MDEVKELLYAILKNQELTNARIERLETELRSFKLETEEFQDEMYGFRNSMYEWKNDIYDFGLDANKRRSG